MKKVEVFETSDGEQFATEDAAHAHEHKLMQEKSNLEKYKVSHKELLDLLNKAQILLNTKPELSKLKSYLEDYDSSGPLYTIIENITDYDGNKDDQLNYQSSYYSSNC